MNQNMEPVIREVEKAVEERQVSVDGEIHRLKAPFAPPPPRF